jgi:2-dehydro-3-deoxyphosphogluconate aldolase/(4S)-4-hydroxy-2-oxoglutarate aldolase
MSAAERIKKERFIALARNVPPELMEDLAAALSDGGVRVFEAAFNPADPDTIEKTARFIRAGLKAGMLTGAGTVLTANAAEKARGAGAEFIISPNTDEKVIRRTKELGMASIPGALTPTEIVRAHELGADIVKIFPVLPDRIEYLKVIVQPLPHITFMVTGGVSPENAGAFLRAGAAAVAAGAGIVKGELLRNKNWAGIRRLAAEHVAAVKQEGF